MRNSTAADTSILLLLLNGSQRGNLYFFLKKHPKKSNSEPRKFTA